ncbi:MAG TPA: GGDEF domain-containing protein, partial [Luteimonas sp.]|nr:GGDEF domain-containing protein [Luteimonas sp.]
AGCLLGLQWLDAVLPVVGTAVLMGAGALVLWLGATAGRRQVPMARTVTALAALCAVAALAAAFLPPGRWLDPVWVRYGWQLLLVATASALALGLIARISEYRNQRDRDRLARADSERRMRREAARADLNTALQAKLRTLPAGDVEWAAFRLLLDHLVPQVPVAFATAIAYGFQGQDIRVVVPQAHKATVDAIAAQRLLPLKRHAANGMPLQQPVTLASEQGVVAMEAVIPLPIRSPAWGLLLLHRTGGDGFSTDELALAGEFGRLALFNIEQALSAINLRRSAELDALTGAFNRRTIDQWLVRCFADADRDGQPVSVLFVDMDHFKLINDRHGHAAGDQCLREVARTLRATLADGDLLGRYGGEEFIAVLPGRGGAAGRVVGEQLRAAVERMRCEWEGQPLQLSVSVGVATRLREEGTPAETVDRADKALYTAKRSGRNRVHVAPAVFS